MSDSLQILPLENFQSHDDLERKTGLETFSRGGGVELRGGGWRSSNLGFVFFTRVCQVRLYPRKSVPAIKTASEYRNYDPMSRTYHPY